MFCNELVENFLQSRSSDLLQLITDLHNGLFDLDEARQVDRSTDNNSVARSVGDGLLEVLHLLSTITHSGQQGTDVRINLEGLGEFANDVRSRVNEFSTVFQSGNRTGTDLHLTVGQCRTVFHHEDFLALEEFGFVNREDRSSVDLLSRRVDFAQVSADGVDIVEGSGVDLEKYAYKLKTPALEFEKKTAKSYSRILYVSMRNATGTSKEQDSA